MIHKLLVGRCVHSFEHIVYYWVICDTRDPFVIATCWRKIRVINALFLSIILAVNHIQLVDILFEPLVVAVLLQVVSQHLVVQKKFVNLVVEFTFLAFIFFALVVVTVIYLHQQVIHDIMSQILIIWRIIPVDCFELRFVKYSIIPSSPNTETSTPQSIVAFLDLLYLLLLLLTQLPIQFDGLLIDFWVHILTCFLDVVFVQ